MSKYGGPKSRFNSGKPSRDDYEDPRARLVGSRPSRELPTNKPAKVKPARKPRKINTRAAKNIVYSRLKIIKLSALRHKKVYIPAIAAIILGAIVVFYFLQPKTEVPNVNEINPTVVNRPELPKETPSFKLLYPTGRDPGQYEVVRSNPEGKDISYTYLERLSDSGPIFRVTQQKVPDNFDLATTAEGFNATKVIVVDSVKVYHGYSVTGGIQYLMFVKKDRLVLVRSPQQFSDDTWAAYVASLK